MVNKTVQQLISQEKDLEKGIIKYNGSPKLIRAEQITENQIRSKGGVVPSDSPRVAALKRAMKKSKP